MKFDQAKHMYFSGIPPHEITDELDIPINEIGIRIFGNDKSGHDPLCWYQQRSTVDPGSFVTYRKVKTYILDSVNARLIKKLHSSAVALTADDSPELDINDMATATKVVSEIDKISRLEKGEATEIVHQDQGFTLREIRNGTRIVENEATNNQTKEIPHEQVTTTEGSGNESEEQEGEGTREYRAPDLPHFRTAGRSDY